MLRYVLRRLLIAIPTLLIISLAVFGISKCAPGDPVENIFGEEMIQIFTPEQLSENYRRKAAQLGLDKPVFYFNISPAAYPDTLWKIYPLDRRNRLADLTAQNGNWPANLRFEASIFETQRQLELLPDSSLEKPYFRLAISELSVQTELPKLNMHFGLADSVFRRIPEATPALSQSMDSLRKHTRVASEDLRKSALNTPAFHWYGLNNQYQHWLSGFLTGNWGLTKRQKPVWQELRPAFMATLALNGIALLIAYMISIPWGVEMARRKGRPFDLWSQRFLLLLKAMPVFWVGSLLVVLLCTPVFGKAIIASPYLDITDTWNMHSESFFSWFAHKFPKFILPMLVLILYSLALVTMQMRGGMLETLRSDYIRTARSKGLSEKAVHWRHAFRNALFPVITIFAAVFPALFTGSLVIETLFNFPGMGQLAQSAFQSHDLTMLSAILMIAAFFSIIGNLLADLMYAWVDPRVRYTSK